MQSRIEGRDGWIEVTRDGVAVLAKGDDALAERIGAALDAADGDELADVVTDELSSGGVRRTPDFAVVDHASGRVLVRGTASVQVVTADGSTREFLAPARGPWADEDAVLDGEVVLVTGEPEPAPTPADVAEPESEPESGAAEPEVAEATGATEETPADPMSPQVAHPEATDAEPTPSEPAEAEALAPQEEPAPEPVAEPPVAGEPAAEEPTVEPAPQETAVEEPVAEEPPSAQPTGWAVPSVFGGAPAASGAATSRPQLSVVPDTAPGPDSSGQPARDPAPTAPTDQQPVEAGEVVETPAPQAQELSEPEAAPAEPAPVAAPTAPSGTPAGEAPGAPAPAAARGDDEEELPSFDFLFGNTHSHRSSLLAGLEEEEEAQESIDSGPVAAAGGFQAQDNPANATLAPPTEEDEAPAPARPQGPTVGALPGGLPPMPGSAPAQQDDHGDAGWSPEQPMADGPAEPPAPQPFAGSGPSRVQAARDDASGHEPGVVRPQFADGHLVGSRVPTSTPAAAPTTEAAPPSPAAEPAADDGGVISAVPWGGGAAAPGMPGGLPPLPTPDHGAAEPVPAAAAPEEVGVDTGEIPSGPMVLAVRCSLGHHNAPHATRCRVCGQDLPTQTPEQTPRPALGLLRLSTGDVVTLDRGVLIGRAPRASAEASGARAPHLVRISSPDNEISRNHVEIVLDGWHVLVRDLGSTNGTTVALPGSSPVRVRPGDQQTIEPGTTITLADQVSMVFEVTG